MIIQFDVDGVLADFNLAFNMKHTERYGVPRERPQRWNDQTDALVWEDIKESPNFWSSLPTLASGSAFRDINTLEYMGHSVYFVTARVGREPKRQTYEWLKACGIDHPTVIVSLLKAVIAEGLGTTHAIDDKFGNAYVVSLLKGVKSYLLDAPYNRLDHGIVGGRVRRINSVEDFLSEVFRDVAKEVR